MQRAWLVMEWRIEANLYRATSVEDMKEKLICPFSPKTIFLEPISNRIFPEGTWCSGITPAQHAGCHGFNPQRVHLLHMSLCARHARRGDVVWCDAHIARRSVAPSDEC